MDADDSWAALFHLPLLAAEEPDRRPSIRDQLFPRCPTCGVTCGELCS